LEVGSDLVLHRFGSAGFRRLIQALDSEGDEFVRNGIFQSICLTYSGKSIFKVLALKNERDPEAVPGFDKETENVARF